MTKRHYIPVTADVPGAASEGNCTLIRKVIRTALAAEGVDVPCEVDVLLTNDSGIHEINREMRQVDASTDVLSFPEFDLRPGTSGRSLAFSRSSSFVTPAASSHKRYTALRAAGPCRTSCIECVIRRSCP